MLGSEQFFRLLVDVSHVGHHYVRPEVQSEPARFQQGLEQTAVGYGRRLDQGYHGHVVPLIGMSKDQSKGMFFISNEEGGLAGFL